MSSPIRQAEDIDAPLVYAPPWARERARDQVRERTPDCPQLRPETSSTPALAEPRRRWSITGPAFSGDLAMATLQRQLALHPDAVPQPPFEHEQSMWPIAGRIGAVAAVAALVAWGMVSLPGARLLHNDAKPGGAPPTALAVQTQSPRPAAPAAVAVAAATPEPMPSAGTTEEPPPSPALQDTAQAASAMQVLVKHGLAEASAQPQTPPPAWPPSVLPQATPQQSTPPQPPPAPEAAAPASRPSAPVDSDEIATLVKRGKDYLSNGDLSSARLALRRAADAGSADAALALGATYDPVVIRRLGAIGAAPDIAKAREWYQKAIALGSDAASQQLARLAQGAQ